MAIRNRTCILSTDPDLIRSLVQKQRPGHSEHQPVSGRPRQLGGLSLAQYAGSYCEGFADHVAQQLLPPAAAEGFAVDTVNPLTRKRQKTAVDLAIPTSRFGAQKRSCSPSTEGNSRSQAQPRTSENNAAKAGSPLPETIWKPIFEMVSKVTSKVSPSLVPPQGPLIEAIQQQLPKYQVTQVFAGCGGRQLHWPLGALPNPVAPWRLSIYQPTKPDGQVEFVCCEPELRVLSPALRDEARLDP